jgi:hypothetical protein
VHGRERKKAMVAAAQRSASGLGLSLRLMRLLQQQRCDPVTHPAPSSVQLAQERAAAAPPLGGQHVHQAPYAATPSHPHTHTVLCTAPGWMALEGEMEGGRGGKGRCPSASELPCAACPPAFLPLARRSGPDHLREAPGDCNRARWAATRWTVRGLCLRLVRQPGGAGAHLRRVQLRLLRGTLVSASRAIAPPQHTHARS